MDSLLVSVCVYMIEPVRWHKSWLNNSMLHLWFGSFSLRKLRLMQVQRRRGFSIALCLRWYGKRIMLYLYWKSNTQMKPKRSPTVSTWLDVQCTYTKSYVAWYEYYYYCVLHRLKSFRAQNVQNKSAWMHECTFHWCHMRLFWCSHNKARWRKWTCRVPYALFQFGFGKMKIDDTQ